MTQKTTITGTIYRNCNCKKGECLATLPEWMAKIQSEIYQNVVENYRECLSSGQKDMAHQLKRSMPAFICTAQCMLGRKEGTEEGRSQIVMADYDNHNAAWSADLRDRLKVYPWIAAAHQTVSYGLRVFIYTPLMDRSIFKQGMELILHELDKICGFPHDKQTLNLLRMSFASYDPDAWCRPVEELVAFPLQHPELASTIRTDASSEEESALEVAEPKAQQPVSLLPLSSEATTETLASIPSPSDSFTEKDVCVPSFILSQKKRHYTNEQIIQFLNHWLEQHPYARGSRNDALIFIGLRAGSKHFLEDDLEYLLEVTYRQFGDTEYTFGEMRKRIEWGWKSSMNGNSNVLQNPFKSPSEEVEKQEKNFSFSTFSTNSTMGEPFPLIKEKDADNELATIKSFEEVCPYFDPEIDKHLPPEISSLLFAATTRREHDILMMAAFTAMSAALPNLSVALRKKKYSANLFFLVVAPPGSGKGVAMLAENLLQPIEDELTVKFETQKQRYDRKLEIWEHEKRHAFAKHKEPDWSHDPGKAPERPTILFSASTSKSQLVRTLTANPDGVACFVSEMDELSSALGSDYGKHAAELRGIAMNERISINYKVDGRQLTCRCPRMSLCATGTPDQVSAFIPSVQDGMLSRCAVLMGESIVKWLPYANENERIDDEIEKAFSASALKVKKMYAYLKENPTVVRLTIHQLHRMDALFENALMAIRLENHLDLHSVIVRGGLIIARICAILTGIRKANQHLTDTEMYVTDEDFEVAFRLSIVLLRHCLQLSTTLPETTKTKEMHNFFVMEAAYKSLPEEVSSRQLLETLMVQYKMSQTTAYNYRKIYLQYHLLEPIGKRLFRKTGREFPKL